MMYIIIPAVTMNASTMPVPPPDPILPRKQYATNINMTHAGTDTSHEGKRCQFGRHSASSN